jgi:hypothetical protein
VIDPTFWATVSGTVVAVITLIVGFWGLQRQLRQNYMITGAQAATEWRTQVIELHDRGLTPDQIRHIMYLERGGAGYEHSNGPIEQIVRNIPRIIPSGIEPQPQDCGTAERSAVPRWNGKLKVAGSGSERSWSA